MKRYSLLLSVCIACFLAMPIASVYSIGGQQPSPSLFQAKKTTVFADDVEAGQGGWVHGAGSGSDLWHVTSADSHSPTHAWLCGFDGGGYVDDMDDWLVSPVVNLSGYSSASLSFWHWYEIESGYDGGLVEISVDGGSWQQLSPISGYPDTISTGGNAAFPSGTPVFSGSSGGWEQVVFNLTGFVGDTVQLRFRFGSDGSVHDDTGWYIDDVVVTGVPVGPLPDLVVDDISLSPSSPGDGDTVFVNTTVSNTGNATATNITLAYSDVIFDSETPLGWSNIGSLAPAQQVTVSMQWQATAGYHLIEVTADPNGTIDEFSESNNRMERQVTVQSGNIPPTCSLLTPQGQTAVNGTVAITGTASDADGTISSVWVRIGMQEWQQASGTNSWQYTWDTAAVDNGFYDITAVAYDGTDVSSYRSAVVTVDNAPATYTVQWSHNYGSSITDARYQGAQPIGDADNDGENELLLGGRDSELHVMKWNSTAATYQEQALITEPDGSGDNPGGFSIGDVDNDGDNEIAVAWDHRFSAFSWDGSGYVQMGTTWTGNGTDETYDCYIGDFDDSGDNEVILADAPYSSSMPEITVLKWNASQSDFMEITAYNFAGDQTTPMAWVADVDNDSSSEIICSPGYDLVALEWNGTALTPTSIATFPSPVYACVCGDANGNGIPEIAVGPHSPTGYIYEWDGDSYEQLWEHTWAGEDDIIEAVAIGDSDNDGTPEIGFGTNLVHLVQWNGSSYTEEAVLTATHGMLAPLAIGDTDNDGNNEINAGNVDGPPYIEWVFDPQPSVRPTCTIATPANGSQVNGTVTVVGTAQASSGTIDSVLVRIDDGPWQPATGSGGSTVNWSFAWDTTQMAGGIHTIYAGACTGERCSVVDVVTVTSANASTSVDIDLQSGWNLVTVPVGNDFSASSLGNAIPGCEIVAYWNASAGMFESYVVGVTPGDGFAIEDGVGYFVYVNTSDTFSVTGAPLSTVAVDLYTGWNTIGWFDAAATSASSLAPSVPYCSIAAYWNASSSTFESYTVGVTPPPGFTITRGMGVFVYVTAPGTWNGQG